MELGWTYMEILKKNARIFLFLFFGLSFGVLALFFFI